MGWGREREGHRVSIGNSAEGKDDYKDVLWVEETRSIQIRSIDEVVDALLSLPQTVIEAKAGKTFEVVYRMNATRKLVNYELTVDGRLADYYNYNCDRSAAKKEVEFSVEGFEEEGNDGTCTIRAFTFGRMQMTGEWFLERLQGQASSV
jgi:hypothetical protein